MNFFEHQDRARRNTRGLILVMLVAVALLLAALNAVVLMAVALMQGVMPDRVWLGEQLNVIATVSFLGAAFIGLAGLLRSESLRGGGGRVARDLGGTPVEMDTSDPKRRQLVNVVEEMAIAAGIPVPEIYVLENEPAINAFAAGYGPGDAAVAVTRGTLEKLNREELQGVMGHEFSHILNGDMRLNTRLMGMTFGIMVIGMIGRGLLRGMFYTGGARRRGGGGDARVQLALIATALALVVIGMLGVIAGRLIQAAVSRKREFLADATAVQLTRSSDGIAGALRKIGGLDGSTLTASRSEEIGHMLFGPGRKLWGSALATHPPLRERLRAIQPHVRHDLSSAAESATGRAGASPAAAGFSSGEQSAVEHAGAPDDGDLKAAQALLAGLPKLLVKTAHSDSGAALVIAACLLSSDSKVARRQQTLLSQYWGSEAASACEQLNRIIQRHGPAVRLPLLEMAFPVLRRKPLAERDALVVLCHQLVAADGQVSAFEYSLTRLLKQLLDEVENPARKQSGWLTRDAYQEAASVLFSVVAAHGRDNSDSIHDAAMAGLTRLFPNNTPAAQAENSGWRQFDEALGTLDRLHGSDKQRLLLALETTIRHDDVVTPAQSDLLRVICASLHVPVPPVHPVTPA